MLSLRHSERGARLLVACVAVILATGTLSCGADSPTEPGTLVLGLNQPTVSVVSGKSGTVAIEVQRGGSFAGPVTIAVEGAAAGISVSLTPASLPAGQSTATITISVAAGTAPSTSTLLVRVRGEGVGEQTASIALTILPPPAFTMSLARDTMAVRATRADTLVVSAVRTGGFAGPITLTVAGLPQGVTAAAVTMPADSTTARLVVVAGAGVALGDSLVRVEGRGTGVEDRSAQLVLRLLEAPAFSIALASDSVQLIAGGSHTIAVDVTRTGGFGGPVSLALTGLPSGVTGAASVIDSGSTAGSVVLTAADSAAVGTASFAVVATGPDVASSTLPAKVTVVPAAGFMLTLGADSLEIGAGGSAALQVSVSRHAGFAGSVTIAAEGLPAGITADSVVVPADAAGATLAFTAGTSATPDTVVVTLRARAEGLADRTAPLSLRVLPLLVSVALTPPTASVVAGETMQLTATVTGHPDTTLTWSSSAADIADIDSTGLVTAAATGVVTITARSTIDTTASASATIAVTAVAGVGTLLQPGDTLTAQGAQAQEKRYYRVIVPQGATQLTVQTTGSTGDLDLYVRRAQAPDTVTADCMSAGPSSTERCVVSAPAAGEWFILAYAYGAFSGVSVTSAVTSVPTPGFTLTTDRTTLTMKQGASDQVTVSVTRTGGFTGAVTLNVGGLRAGMTAPTVTIPSGANSAVLEVLSSETTPLGSSAAMLRGRSTPLDDRHIPLALAVTPAPGTGDFSIEVVPELITLRPGFAETLGVRTWRSSGLAADITLSIDGLPASITPNGPPIPFTTDSGSIVLTASTGAQPLTRVIVIRGSIPGLEDRADTVRLEIAAIPPTGFSFDSMAVGQQHGCGLRDGEAFCWGNNAYGQLGNGTILTSLAPVRVYTDLRFRTISIKGVHTCAITLDDEAHCWGANEYGQLGTGDTHDRLLPVPVGGGQKWKSISAGVQQTCGITADDKAYCWGGNFWGQLGDGTSTERYAPTPVSGGHSFRHIATNSHHTCGVTTAGNALCWGVNTFGELGDSTGIGRKEPTAVRTTLSFTMVVPASDFTCGLATGGAAHCWGNHSYGYLGDGTEWPHPPRKTPAAVAGGHSFRSITSGISHMCAVKESGAAFCWGRAAEGQGGSGNTSTPREPEPVADDIPFVNVWAGHSGTCGSTSDKRSYCWGLNNHGQMGDGSTRPRYTPFGRILFPGFTLTATPSASGVMKGDTTELVVTVTRVGTFVGGVSLELKGLLTGVSPLGYLWIPPESRVITIPLAASDSATIGRTNLTIEGRGDGYSGSATAQLYVQPVMPTGPFQQISAGASHSCALSDVGQAFCWGFSGGLSYIGGGALGDGSEETRIFPTAVYTNTLWARIAAGGLFTCALDKTGDPFCWGRNNVGQLGNGITGNRNAPTRVATTVKFDSIYAGAEFACALSSGEAWCWGNNVFGQLGNGSTTMSREPVRVAGGLKFRSLSIHSGGQHACGVTESGQAQCWGRNVKGQLGTGDWTNALQPTLVTGGKTWKSVSAGTNLTCGIATDGKSYCWGSGANGAMGNGDGSWVDYLEPTLVQGGQSFSFVTAGSGWACGTTGTQTYCWGLNLYGHIGDGTTENRFLPTPVSGDPGFASLSTGTSHSCGVTQAGNGYCWGYNHSGRLGDGTVSRRLTPNPVKLP